MIVVSDTSPIICLSAIGQLCLLPALYGKVIIPTAVSDELRAAGESAPGYAALKEPWLHVIPIKDQSIINRWSSELDLGEAEALALAAEIGANLLLIDEKSARVRAERLGVEVVGLLGVLLVAKARGLLPKVGPVIEDLRIRASYWISEALVRSTLNAAGEAEDAK